MTRFSTCCKIKSLECGNTDATYLAVSLKSHWFAMTVTILLLLVALVLLLTAATSPATPGSDLVSCTFVLFGRHPRSMNFNSLQVSPKEDKRARNKI